MKVYKTMILPIVRFINQVRTKYFESIGEEKTTQNFWGHKSQWSIIKEKQPGASGVVRKAKYHRQDNCKEIRVDRAYNKDAN